MLKRAVIAFAAALTFASAARADMMLSEVGGFGLLGVPTSAIVGSTLAGTDLDFITDLPVPLILNGWVVEVSFSSLGYYGGGSPAQVCTGSTGVCTDTAFSTAGSAPQWTSQALFPSAITMSVTRPGFTSSATPTTVATTVSLTGFLRNPYPYSNPLIGQSAGKTVVDFIASNYIFADDTTGSLNFPLNVYWDGSLNSGVNTSVPVANNSTRAYPEPIGAWITEPGNRYDGTANATIEFFAGQAYGQGGAPDAAVRIGMGDAGYSVTAGSSIAAGSTTQIKLAATDSDANLVGATVTDTTATGSPLLGTVVSYCASCYTGGFPAITLSAAALASGSGSNDTLNIAHTVSHVVSTPTQSTRLPSTTCTATNGSNVLQNCGTVAWAKVGQRLNVPHVPGQPVIGKIDLTSGGRCTTAPCLELYVQENATFNTDGSLTIALSTGAVGGGTLPSGTALADGGFLGQTVTEVGASGLWTSPTQTIVAPYGTSADTHTSGTTLTMPTPAQGQWRPNMMLYDATAQTTGASASCLPLDVTSANRSEYLTAANTVALNLNTAPAPNCNGHVLSGLGIAGAPGSSTVSSIDVSTSSSAGNVASSGADTVQFNHNYQGATGSVTVTAGSPVPVYAATFTPTDFAALNTNASNATVAGPIAFRAQAYPVVGDQILDTRAPMAIGAQVSATAGWPAAATAVTVRNCTGISFYDQRSVEIVDLTSGANIGVATSCSGSTLGVSGGALVGGTSGDVLAVGVNVDCDWWFFNYQSAGNGFLASGAANGVPQSCTPSNGAWFGAGVANAKNVSVNLHNLFAYYDAYSSGLSQDFAPRYAWISSSGVSSGVIQSTATDPGTPGTNYFDTVAHAITAAKTYNNNASNRHTAHNDTNGIVFCLVSTGSPWALSLNTTPFTTTAWTPPPTVTSAVSGSPCPAPGQYGGSTAVQIKESGSTGQNFSQLRVQNLTLTNTGALATAVLKGPDALPTAAFPTGYLILDNDVVAMTSSNGTAFTSIGAIYAYDLIDTETPIKSNLTASNSGQTSAPLIAGSTVVCGAYAAPVTTITPYTVLGDDTWDCPVAGAGGIATLSNLQSPWPNSEIIAFSRLMGAAQQPGLTPVSAFVAQNNILVVNDVMESINTHFSNNVTLELSGDSYYSPVDNVLETYNSTAGGRVNQNYIEGFEPSSAVVASGGSYATGVVWHELAYSRASNPTVVSSVDTGGNGFWAATALNIVSANSSITVTYPTDFTELATIYADVSATPGTFTATSSGATMTVSAVSSGTLGLGYAMETTGGAAVLHSGAPVTIIACPVGGCNATGAYTLSATPTSAMSGNYYSVYPAGGIQHLADVASGTVNSQSGTSLTVSATGFVGNLYPGATLTNGSALVQTSGGAPVQIAKCPNAGCASTGSGNAYTLTGTPATTMSGTFYAQATQLTMSQNITIIGLDALTTVAPVASNTFPNRDYFKTRWIDKFSNWVDMNLKADYFPGAMANGGRIGNWERRFGVETTGDVYQTLNYNNSYFQPSSQGGDIVPANTFFTNAGTFYSNMSSIRYAVGDDRSTGGADGSNPTSSTYPGLNIGEGDYCPTTSTTLPGTSASITNSAQMVGRVLGAQAQAQWPFDIEGNARLGQTSANNGWSGAYENGCY